MSVDAKPSTVLRGLCTLYMTLLLRGSCVVALEKLYIRSLMSLLLFILDIWFGNCGFLERCSCLTKMPVMFKMLELLALEGLKMRLFELEVGGCDATACRPSAHG